MFEELLFNYIAENFRLTGFACEFGFGTIPDQTQAPYIIQYSLDTNGDRKFLCNADDFTDGEAFIQWNIYCSEPSNAYFIKQKLMAFIAGLKHLTSNNNEYMIQLNTGETSPSGTDPNTGLFVEIVSRSFTYNKGD